MTVKRLAIILISKDFERSINELNTNIDTIGKKFLILGAGGVVPSIIYALNKMNVSQIIVTNRTKSKAENLKNIFKKLKDS